MASFTNVAEITPFKSMLKMKVRIIRLWKQYSASGGLTFEMVLVDSNGVKIHASLKREFVNQFDIFLDQGVSKILINFSVGHSSGSYRTTIHPYKISFLETTRVRNCEEFPISVKGFEPAKYRHILYGSIRPDVKSAWKAESSSRKKTFQIGLYEHVSSDIVELSSTKVGDWYEYHNIDRFDVIEMPSDKLRSKLSLWMENNNSAHDKKNMMYSYCEAKNIFLWDSKAKVWELEEEI